MYRPCRLPLPPAAACRRPLPYFAPLPPNRARSFLLLLTLVAAAAGVRFLVGFGMKALRGDAHVGAAGCWVQAGWAAWVCGWR